MKKENKKLLAGPPKISVHLAISNGPVPPVFEVQ